MSGYRRFIAYVYEYEKGKKSTNCGFIKVEVREQRCTIEVHLHCPGISPDIPCTVYGFIRKDGLINGIPLADCETEADTVECLIETDSYNMNDSGFSLGKMGGIILVTQTGLFFGTEWDDQNIRPDDFHELQTPSTVSASPVSNVPDTDVSVNSNADHRDIIANPIPDGSNVLSEPKPDNFASCAEPDPSLEKQSTDSQLSESVSASVSQAVPVSEAPDADSTSEISEDQNINNLSESSTDTDDSSCSSTSKTQSAKEHFELPFGEKFFPFNDGEFTGCWKIQPRDFLYFPTQANALQNNRFLQYGFYNFGHLLLGQHSNGQYILGVPGGYHQQERFMANMFGFPYFKESSYVQLPGLRGGYWYRLINAPNFDHGHRPQ